VFRDKERAGKEGQPIPEDDNVEEEGPWYL
jgi:hypothetical protein